MRILLVGMILSLQGCVLFLGHVRPARFVDASDGPLDCQESEGRCAPHSWICVADNDTRNPGGLMCGDEAAVRDIQRQMFGPPDASPAPAPTTPDVKM